MTHVTQLNIIISNSTEKKTCFPKELCLKVLFGDTRDLLESFGAKNLCKNFFAVGYDYSLTIQ